MTDLSGQPWLNDVATVAVLDALEAAGGPGCVRFVGGCVRNALMAQPVDDIDLSTTLPPEAVIAALKAAGLKSVPTGLAHGTVTAIARRQPFEITTLRRDVSTDGRNATVAFTDDWGEDAARRDFRLNALYADRTGRIFDPTGEGLADAAAGRIVFVGDPATRIQEDYLRILRFFRFQAWYGRGDADAAGLAACTALHPGMARLSAERVSKELLKLLAAPDPRPAVRAMSDTGVLGQIMPVPVSLVRFEAMVAVSDDVALRLSALLPVATEAVMKAAVALRLSNALRNRLIDAVSKRVVPTASGADIRAMLYRAERQAVLDRLARTAADHPDADLGELCAIARDWPIPRLPVGGREVAQAGVAAGPDTGRILKAFEDSWIADDFPTDGHEARLRGLVAAG
ncbi:MAG: CCA tRNA nucleotidyltransferase [Alphaproteobacteria bacterium]|nr:MAG: CCA tRNA nucleotidyltransferase [Alphaproteobacteria bacterium]